MPKDPLSRVAIASVPANPGQVGSGAARESGAMVLWVPGSGICLMTSGQFCCPGSRAAVMLGLYECREDTDEDMLLVRMGPPGRRGRARAHGV